MNRIRSFWLVLHSSLWFLPFAILCASVAAALALINVQTTIDADLASRWPRLFGAGADGARGMLSAIATSMITVAGVVFSITVVSLSLAASQYSPRVLRNFMSDRATQAVLGAFVAIYAYCLIVLRTVRGPDEGGFVPSLAVLGGMAMAFVGVFLLVYFVHHVATAIQVSSILERISGETKASIERLFPDTVGATADPAAQPLAAPASLPEAWCDVLAPGTGYIIAVDGEALLDTAEARSLLVEIVPRVGEFVIRDLPLLRVASADPLDDADRKALLACFEIGRQRTVHQDAPFGLQQIVDVAMKALSPGVNDPTTAVACIDHLGALLALLATREVPGPFRARNGVVHVVAHGPDFSSMLSLSFDAVSEHAANHVEVYERLVSTLGQLAHATTDRGRRAALSRQLDIAASCAGRGGVPGHRRQAFEQALTAAQARLAGEQPSSPAAVLAQAHEQAHARTSAEHTR